MHLHNLLAAILRTEWSNLRKHDVAFLICLRPQCQIGTKYDRKQHFVPQVY